MAEWGYEEHNGPSHWKQFAPACTGACQSPVDIVTSKVKFNSKLQPLDLKADPSGGDVLVNNGRTVQVNVGGKSTLGGGPLTGSYMLKQFHFHWGDKDGVGSEHTVNGKSYSAELHLVHWNTQYASFEEALKHPDGLAVLAVFLEVGPTDNQDLMNLQKYFPKVINPSTTTTLPTHYNYTKLLPGNLKNYWTYPGSLTTPPCLEAVIFVIYQQPISVSSKQLNIFRSLKPLWTAKETDKKKVAGARLENNCRPTNPLNDRVVAASFQ